jgi:hypothetical protein
MPHRSFLPVSLYKREQAAISRRSLIPITIFYPAFAIAVLVLGLRSGHPYQALAWFFLGGLPMWTLVEYTSHRWVFHKHWPISKRPIKKYFTYLSNRFLEPTHFGHHDRPFDGTHINGRLRDLMPVFVPAVAFCLFFPVYTLLTLLGGVVFFYVAEEWIHHCEHYYNFRNRYFKHIKKYHLYHHTSGGALGGYGITNAFWDVIFASRLPKDVRDRLFGRKATAPRAKSQAVSST